MLSMIKIIFHVILACIHIWTINVNPCDCLDGVEALYTSTDVGIAILDSDNFTGHVNDRDNAFIIEFYNSWCGHCIRFAPLWKNFSRSIVKWNKVVQIGVLDCAEDKNVVLCRKYEVMSYPSIVYFWPQYSDNGDLQPVPGKIGEIDEIRHDFLDYLHDNWNRSIPKIWPNLELLDIKDTSDWEKFSSSADGKDVLLIAESEFSYIGREVILDLSDQRDQFIIRRIKPDNPWLKSLDVDVYNIPYVLKFTSKTKSPSLFWKIINPKDNLRESLTNFILTEYKLNPNNPISSSDSHPVVLNSQLDSPQSIPDDVHLVDLYRSLHYTLYKQIPLHKKLGSAKLGIVKRFIEIVLDHFPFHTPEAHSFISMLSRWLSTKVHNLDIDEFVDTLSLLEGENKLPRYDDWKTCQGSKPRFRGYPCSLWIFFHTLTVDEYLEQLSDPMRFSQHKVLRTMRDYITNFFSCSECARHFGEMATDLETSLKHPNSSVLWLWRAHNQVNKRLAGDDTEDPAHKKTQFPSKSLCPSCWTTQGTFNEQEVFKFLINHFRRSTILDPSKLETEPLYSSEPKPSSSKISSNDVNFNQSDRLWAWPNLFLSRLDISLCLLLYILTSCMLLTFCFILSIKKRRKRVLRNKYPINP
ncbi:sulfhydryl oxidase 2-like [Brevipalpus obovatus]|uniref:sulfhydryl oxidase 2-like n=1 Tax=Brevipalpus obovatus TaxID=246614 RepID=UPI003D9F8697